jgi:hypothetical protein
MSRASRALAVISCVISSFDCAHQRVYTLGDDLSVEETAQGIIVRNERPSIVSGLEKGPLVVFRPSKDHAANRCFEGFYNRAERRLTDSALSDWLEPFALCPDPDAPSDKTAFRLDLQATSAKKGSSISAVHATREVKQLPFTARVAAVGSADVRLEGAESRRVHLPDDFGPFREHPELIGALVALGALPPSQTGLQR